MRKIEIDFPLMILGPSSHYQSRFNETILIITWSVTTFVGCNAHEACTDRCTFAYFFCTRG